MVAGGISGTIEETMDAINDYRDDGEQSVGDRLVSVGLNTTIAGTGEAIFTAARKGLAGVKKIVNGSIREVKFKEVEGTAKAKAEVEGKAKELEEVGSGGTGDVAEGDLYVGGSGNIDATPSTIKYLEDMIKNEEFEHGVIFDSNGKVLSNIITDSHPTKINFAPYKDQIKNAIITHLDSQKFYSAKKPTNRVPDQRFPAWI